MLQRNLFFFFSIFFMMLLTACVSSTSTIDITRNSLTPTQVLDYKTPVPVRTSSPVTNTPIPDITSVSSISSCQNDKIPEKVLSEHIDNLFNDKRVVTSDSFLYLGIDQYIGVFDVSIPSQPQLLGFWSFPDELNISSLHVSNGLMYLVSGSNLVVLRLLSTCQFEHMGTFEMPFQISQLEIKDKLLYLGHIVTNTNETYIAVFSLHNPTNPQELGTISLGQTLQWFVSGNFIYSFGDVINRIDASDIANPQFETIELASNLSISPAFPITLIGDTLYAIGTPQRITIISGLQKDSPTVWQSSENQILMGRIDYIVYQALQNYIVLGQYPCDVECYGSTVDFFDIHTGERLSRIGFSEQSPVYMYHEATKNIIYAFSANTLFVINMSEVNEPFITKTISLTN